MTFQIVRQSRRNPPVVIWLVGGGYADGTLDDRVYEYLAGMAAQNYIVQIITVRDYQGDYWARQWARRQRPAIPIRTVTPSEVNPNLFDVIDRAADYVEGHGSHVAKVVALFGGERSEAAAVVASDRGFISNDETTPEE